MGRRRSSASVSTLQILGVVVVLLLAGIALAFLLAPDKPEAPPTSAISYDAKPRTRTPSRPAQEDPFEAPTVQAVQRPRTPDAAPATPDEAEKSAPYRIFATVVDAKTGQPLSKARVHISREWTREEQRDLQDRITAAVKDRDIKTADALREEEQRLRQQQHKNTGEDGTVEIPTMLPGDYTVNVLLEGYMPKKVEGIVLSDQQPEQRVEAKVSTGAVITGRVTETGSNVGAVGVRIELEFSEVISHDLMMAYSGRWPLTNDSGEYRLSGLPPGNYSITVNLSGSPYKLGKVLPYKKVSINTPDQELNGVDFTVDAAGMVWGYVTDTNQQPVKGADLVLCTSESIFSQALNTVARRTQPLHARTDAEGYYELMGVPLNEEWRMYATSENYSPQLSDMFLLTSAARSVRIDVFLFAGSTIYGRVIDHRGTPIPEAEVLCAPAYSQLFAPLESPQAFRDAKTDENGGFEIRELPAGSYQIFAMKKGYKYSASGEPIYPNGYSNISNVQITLYPVDQGEYAVFGTVTDLARAPVDGAEVALEGLSTASFDEIHKETYTDASGGYRFDGISTGMYKITVTKEGYARRTIQRVLFNLPTDVVIETSAVVRGVVLVKGTNRAPQGPYTVKAGPFSLMGEGIISLAGFGERPMSQTFQNPDGSFELYLSSGQYQLEASAAELTPGRMNISLEPGQMLDGVTIYLNESGGTIEGRVVTGDGKSPQGAIVALVESGGSIEEAVAMAMEGGGGPHSMRVGEDGAFSFSNLPAGVYNVIARHESYANADSGPLELAEEGRVRGIVLRLGSGGAVEGRVFINGIAQASAVVMVVGQGTTKTTNTDQNGHYYVDGLATGTYQMVVSPVGAGDLSGVFDTRGAPVDIVEGRTTRYDFGAAGGVRIEGRCMPGPQMGGVVVLHQPSPQPVALGDTVQINQIMNGMNTMVNPLGGGFIFEDVPPGEWQLDVFYVQFGAGVRYVHTDLITITGEQEVVPLDMNVQL